MNIGWKELQNNHSDKLTRGDVIGTVAIVLSFICLISLPYWLVSLH
jgi:hypothetical protein